MLKADWISKWISMDTQIESLSTSRDVIVLPKVLQNYYIIFCINKITV